MGIFPTNLRPVPYKSAPVQQEALKILKTGIIIIISKSFFCRWCVQLVGAPLLLFLVPFTVCSQQCGKCGVGKEREMKEKEKKTNERERKKTNKRERKKTKKRERKKTNKRERKKTNEIKEKERKHINEKERKQMK
jgi:uncharacterized protein YlxW (UPF0749 family)